MKAKEACVDVGGAGVNVRWDVVVFVRASGSPQLMDDEPRYRPQHAGFVFVGRKVRGEECCGVM